MTATIDQLPTIASSVLLAKLHQTTAAVTKHGAMLVTRHDQPSMVLVSIDRYNALNHASSPNLAALTQEFDELYDAMQRSGGSDRMAKAFSMSPTELGQAALTAISTAAVER